ncbi:ATP-grasp domain-containing protein [Mycetocola zhadangensis]|uniref:ATP-grasp domain-containing protein n=1 Tax=Mycetocola zhadangensis TaxID=1164595 RepID=A0A3L7JCH5_9MICO|nr:hypothetical protein [Mycetocola zhadangensis]RLQ86192.1 hypothetical protein D9V28_04990 [Mycetocola zhadangensis]GGE89175.1 hypothetical protein GCM10011313_09830 [Mycetocola zhadangensis]
MTRGRIALVTNARPAPYVDTDLPFLETGLTASGFAPRIVVWNDPHVDWASFELIVIRSPWDYPDSPSEFLDWLDRAAAVAPVLNAPSLIRWNIDKVHLRELGSVSDVPIVPTTFCLTSNEVRAALSTVSEERVVVKPSVSAGSQNTGLFERNDPAALLLAGHILRIGKTVMVQPAIPSVQHRGERALLYFDGDFSHAISKGPLLAVGGGLRGGTYVEEIAPVTPTPEERAVGDQLIAAVHTVLLARGLSEFDALPLYARVDIVDDPSTGPLVLEAELFEPSLFIDTDPDAVRRFVEAVSRRIETIRSR